ncbi:putative mitochondrial hypothetical protein [Leptomonas pyrrhocoris]|uniref:RanBP2-type domain-containing protein n=1 Tax=Leptomonas pyrrhocoris TaxID=157538 RepID=A0A0N0VF33_LEPPY|nr:putative mitochondrial hypothetical protein [Leptomonas pyrrhocoris]KPA80052.1 putative mitochondrial hypothetical protein [Leptomonas pyrrhocoris]|eukprot:XP_015658491.1 putative mitochondrial hypothetical protein [Leptomonas pyrrhocoris]
MRSTARRVAQGTVLGQALHSATPRTTTYAVLRPSIVSRCNAASSPSLSAAAIATARRRYTIATRPLRQSWNSNRVRPWMCGKKECRTVNKAVAMQCEACGTAQPVRQRWKCVDCGTANFAGVKQCKQCKAPSERSKAFWMCADCGENNRIDELEDNSICGFCGYDMAPRTAAQEEALRRTHEAAAALRQQQENYDSVTYKDADDQFADPLEGAQNLDPSLRAPQPSFVTVNSGFASQGLGSDGDSGFANGSDSGGGSGFGRQRLKIPKVGPYTLADQNTATRHSSIHRRSRRSSAAKAVFDASHDPVGPPGFDWMCRAASCGHINPGDEENCLQCGLHVKPNEWECLLCGAMNHLSRSRCFHCHTTIPVCWTCTGCNTATSIYDKVCRSCGLERPLTEPKHLREIDADDDYRRAGVTAQKDGRRGEWYCPGCHQLNFSRRSECFQCGTARPAAGTTAGEEDPFAMTGWGAGATALDQSAAPRAPLHNNWICTHCQASNFRTRHDCWKCGRASQNQNEWSNETIAPQFEHEGFQTGADDKPAEGQMNEQWKVDKDKWTCAKCYAQNFKNRPECYRCGASKTTVMAPRRTKARRPVKL